MGTSHTLNNISRLFIYQKEYDKALEYSTKSLEILKKVQDNRGIGNAHISLGSIYLSKNNVAEAIRMFSIAKDHFVKQGLKGHEGWALLKIANAHEADGKYQSALESCFAAMNLLDARQDLFSSIELYQTIGFIYAAQGDLTNSTEYLRQAIRLADRGHDGQGSMTSRLKMALVFKKFKHYDSALHYHEAYLQLYEETFTGDKARQLATLEKIYQTEKKDQLLDLKNQQLKSQSIIITSISFLLAALTVLGIIIFRYTRDKRKSNIKLKQLNREIQEKHEEILAQSEELTQANQEISRINENLEQEVHLRTEKIERQNQMLIEYAYSNAHNVRGPLARILGLASLMSREDDPELLKEYTTFMYVSAQELDNVIRDINVKLQDEST
jgi:tetratricopeptide (TPR) repeat protein